MTQMYNLEGIYVKYINILILNIYSSISHPMNLMHLMVGILHSCFLHISGGGGGGGGVLLLVS